MKWLEEIVKGSGMKPSDFAYKIGTSHERLRKLLGQSPDTKEKPQTKVDFKILTRIQKLSKLADGAFWKRIREEFED